MSGITLGVIAVGLAMDAFAVSIAAGLALAPVTFRQTARLAFHFGLFQFIMPLLGWFAGAQVEVYVAAVDHWIAFGLLFAIGGKMLWETGRPEADIRSRDPSRGLLLVTLSVATSIDALAVGFSMACLSTAIFLPALVIGAVAAAFSTLGVTLGERFGRLVGPWAERLGGSLLVGIGTHILVSHLRY